VGTLVASLNGTAIFCQGFGTNGSLNVSSTGKLVTIRGESLPNCFTGKLAAFKLEANILVDLEALADWQRYTPQWYIISKVELNRAVFYVGLPTGAATFNVPTATWYQPYARGAILYHSATSSAFEMHGFIRQRYD